MPARKVKTHDDELPDELSDAQLGFLLQMNPGLKKKIEAYREIRSKELEIKARLEGGFSQDNPLVFVRHVLGLKPTTIAKSYGYQDGITPQQLRVLEAIRDNKRVAIPSGHGVGKTFIMAVAVLWYLYGHEDRIVITSAPTWKLIEEQLWREIGSLHSKAKVKLPGKLLQTKLDVGKKWYALGIVSDDPGQFRGFHGPGGTMVIFDEATAMPEHLYDEAESMIIGKHDHFVIIGNPTNNSSKMKKCCDSGMWHVVPLDAREHPNVIHNNPEIVPGAVTAERVGDWLEMYGGPDAAGFLVRAAGQWAVMSNDMLIQYQWILDAQGWDKKQEAKESKSVPFHSEVTTIRGAALGVDIAGLGSDLCVCWEIYNGRAKVLWHSQHTETMETAGRIIRTIREGRGKYQVLAIDDTGIGNGVSSRVLEVQNFAGKPTVMNDDKVDPITTCGVMRINFGGSATVPAKFAVTRFWKIKDEMWWNLREALRKGQLGLPTDEELKKVGFPKGSYMVEQLNTPIWINDSNGAIHVFDKYNEYNERTKALPRRSPDIAHGLMLAQHAYRAVRPEEFTAAAKDPVEFRRRLMAQLMTRENNNKSLLDRQAEEQNMNIPDLYDFV